MKSSPEYLSAVCEESIGNMGSIVRLDKAYQHARFNGGSVKDLTTQQNDTLADLANTFADIRTDDLSNDRLDLLTSFTVDELGTTSAELVVREALSKKISERRKAYEKRQDVLAKKLRGNWLAVSLLADELVLRVPWNINSPPYDPILAGETIYMKLRHEPQGDSFTTFAEGRPDVNARNYIGYAISGVTRRGTGGWFADISIVDADGNPTVNITPLSTKPPKVTHSVGRHELK